MKSELHNVKAHVVAKRAENAANASATGSSCDPIGPHRSTSPNKDL